jgi:hypothetical protein
MRHLLLVNMGLMYLYLLSNHPSQSGAQLIFEGCLKMKSQSGLPYSVNYGTHALLVIGSVCCLFTHEYCYVVVCECNCNAKAGIGPLEWKLYISKHNDSGRHDFQIHLALVLLISYVSTFSLDWNYIIEKPD